METRSTRGRFAAQPGKEENVLRRMMMVKKIGARNDPCTLPTEIILPIIILPKSPFLSLLSRLQ